jgi:hypothetical protein
LVVRKAQSRSHRDQIGGATKFRANLAARKARNRFYMEIA